MTAAELLAAIQDQVILDPGLLHLTAIRMAIRDLEGTGRRPHDAAVYRIAQDLDKLDTAARSAFGDYCQKHYWDNKLYSNEAWK